MTDKNEVVYTEEYVRIIRPLKARIYSDKFERAENYGEDGIKTILFREILTPSK